MSRKTKIAISITGITIILLGLLGLTFGFYLSQITPNNNEKSISLQIGDSKVQFTDLTEEIDALIQPGYQTTKVFTVQNIGNVKATYSIFLASVQNNFTRTADITYNLYRRSGINSIDATNYTNNDLVVTNDNKKIQNIQFPTKDSLVVANEVIENPNDAYTYVMVITYVNSQENQNVDQGKTFGGKINISGLDIYNPYYYNESLLAYNVIQNALINKNGTSFSYSPPTTPAVEKAADDEKVLSVTEDQYGDSYYYRGFVKDNYVNFNNMCWRIVRVEGDGSVKLTLASKDSTCNSELPNDSAFVGTSGSYGYVITEQAPNGFYSYDNGEKENSMKKVLDSWYETNFNSTEEQKVLAQKIKEESICIGDLNTKYIGSNIVLDTTGQNFSYEPYKRLINDGVASLICKDNASKTEPSKIYPLTADEMVFSGLKPVSSRVSGNQSSSYINEHAVHFSSVWYTITPHTHVYQTDRYFAFAYIYGYFQAVQIGYSAGVRPVISLAKGAVITSGDGTVDNPYEIG